MRARGVRRRGSNAGRVRDRGARAGLSLIEVVVTLSVLVVAGSIFCQMLLSGRRVRQVNRETTLAADAARVVLERMRNQPFLTVYRAYNEDPTDDPGGNGTGPGCLFDVEGLEPLEDAPQGKVGRVTFPSLAVEVQSSSGGTSGGKLSLGGGSLGGTTTTQWQLREDVEEEQLGMPRDLNGDNKIDAADHSNDYLLLPVRVRIEWQSGSGSRRFELVTQLGDIPLAEAP